jgi:uncharacterized membrane protein YeaQ/YmgE (transglycosylase-associated protein family)
MTVESLLYLLIYVIVVIGLMCLVGWGARWIIQNFLPEQFRTIAMGIVGALLLILLLLLIIHFVQGGAPSIRLR